MNLQECRRGFLICDSEITANTEVDTELGFSCKRIKDGRKRRYPFVSKHSRQSLTVVLPESMKNIPLTGNNIT